MALATHSARSLRAVCGHVQVGRELPSTFIPRLHTLSASPPSPPQSFVFFLPSNVSRPRGTWLLVWGIEDSCFGPLLLDRAPWMQQASDLESLQNALRASPPTLQTNSCCPIFPPILCLRALLCSPALKDRDKAKAWRPFNHCVSLV